MEILPVSDVREERCRGALGRDDSIASGEYHVETARKVWYGSIHTGREEGGVSGRRWRWELIEDHSTTPLASPLFGWHCFFRGSDTTFLFTLPGNAVS